METKPQNTNAREAEQKTEEKKDFVVPKLERHETLPEVTGLSF